MLSQKLKNKLYDAINDNDSDIIKKIFLKNPILVQKEIDDYESLEQDLKKYIDNNDLEKIKNIVKNVPKIVNAGGCYLYASLLNYTIIEHKFEILKILLSSKDAIFSFTEFDASDDDALAMLVKINNIDIIRLVLQHPNILKIHKDHKKRNINNFYLGLKTTFYEYNNNNIIVAKLLLDHHNVFIPIKYNLSQELLILSSFMRKFEIFNLILEHPDISYSKNIKSVVKKICDDWDKKFCDDWDRKLRNDWNTTITNTKLINSLDDFDILYNLIHLS
jgi:hypothetical protein